MGMYILGTMGGRQKTIKARPNRACATVDWQELFPHYKVSNL